MKKYISFLLILLVLIGPSYAGGCECFESECCVELTPSEEQESPQADCTQPDNSNSCCLTECINPALHVSHLSNALHCTLKILNNTQQIQLDVVPPPDPVTSIYTRQDLPFIKYNAFLLSSKTIALLI